MAILKIRDANGKVSEIPAIKGKSAYEYAKDGGYTGTEEEFTEKMAKDGSVGSNPNLLINGDFRVNQRGLTTYETPNSWQSIFTVDRWMLNAPKSKLIVGDGYVELIKTTDACFFRQKMEHSVNGKLTATVKVKALNGGASCCMRTTDNIDNNIQSLSVGLNVIHFDGEDLQQLLIIPEEIGSSIQIEYIKLEQGSVATQFIPRLYAEELALCQRYYARIGYVATNNMSIASGMFYGETLFVVGYSLPSPMRTSPTAKVNNFKITNYLHTGNDILISGVTPCATTSKDIHLTFTVNAIPTKLFGSIGMLTMRDSTSYLEFDAEIY